MNSAAHHPRSGNSRLRLQRLTVRHVADDGLVFLTRKNLRDRLIGGVDLELLVGRAAVAFDRLLADGEPGGDLSGVVALRAKFQDFALTPGEFF